MHPFLNTAIKAARAAGQVIARSANRVDTLKIQDKQPNDFVTEVDRNAEREIIRVIQRAYPDHGIMAEESGEHDINREFIWVIDPLDGTTNFIHGIPQFAVSIALKQRGRLEQAVVYDPIKEELFVATRGAGAFLNNRRIRVSQHKDLSGTLLGTGIPFREDQDLDYYLRTLKALLPGTAGVRRPGSAALDLAYVACGRLDGFWEIGLNEWDMAAGVLLIQEAGGLVGDLRGGPEYLTTGNVVAAGPKVFKAMLQRLHPVVNREG
ncbi:inositol monophosphatase [Ectothiorhodospira haloalkaliphila]|uniref:Inositol-1-monophosphatase n=1 Tax=Ectothiorhodospira haloalkaliphila TaxID=421628 RepID=W8KRC1_9GAMM|nr:inositol monophosphatase family protein [Ectothiorhodospira haloalkaliphila]AHK79567.1 inositol monophosphatase [Ectothiorhodospira haloalkaliphila]